MTRRCVDHALQESDARMTAMKKLLAMTLALALVGGSATAAMAHGRPGYGPPVHRGYYAQPYGYGYGHGYRRDNGAAALGIGLLAFGLIATLAAQNNARNYYGPPPGYYGPPPRPYGYGY
jgi:hypothetical protein